MPLIYNALFFTNNTVTSLSNNFAVKQDVGNIGVKYLDLKAFINLKKSNSMYKTPLDFETKSARLIHRRIQYVQIWGKGRVNGFQQRSRV